MEVQLDEKWVRDALPMRAETANKGTLGLLTILAGSLRYRGAAALAAHAALRAGAGLVRLASTERVCAATALSMPCCTLHPLPEDAAGGIDPAGLEELLGEKCTALLAGCGMGNTPNTARWVEGLLAGATCPLVLDADALNALAGETATGPDAGLRARGANALRAAAHPVILTPHIGEMARLCGLDIPSVLAAQREVALEYARAHHCMVVLKSHHTVIALPEGDCYINSRAGNAGLARGGSGDVLAGMIASLLAQGHAPHVAAAAGVWLHATAADQAAALYGQNGMLPADLPLLLGEVWRDLGR